MTSSRLTPGPPGQQARRRRGASSDLDTGSSGVGPGGVIISASTALDVILAVSLSQGALASIVSHGGALSSESLWFTKSLSTVVLVAVYGLYCLLRHAVLLRLVGLSYAHLGAAIAWTCAGLCWAGLHNLLSIIIIAVAVVISTHSGVWFTVILGASSQGSGLLSQCVAAVCSHTAVSGLLAIS